MSKFELWKWDLMYIYGNNYIIYESLELKNKIQDVIAKWKVFIIHHFDLDCYWRSLPVKISYEFECPHMYEFNSLFHVDLN